MINVEMANDLEVVQDGRIFIEKVNALFLAAGGNGSEFRAGIERAIALGWPWLHESGTYLKFTDSGAALFGWAYRVRLPSGNFAAAI